MPIILLSVGGAGTLSATAQEVSTELTEPIATSTFDGGSATDITITEDGSISISDTDGVVAVTVDSDNSFTNDGLIEIEDSDNAVGVFIEAGRTSDISGAGSITILEDYTREDDDDDDDLDGPFAIGTGRTGVWLESGGVHTGDFTFEDGVSIAVEGNDSAGVRLLSDIVGGVSMDGSISVLGDNPIGIEATGDISESVLISGSVTAQGVDAVAIELSGDIGGNLTIESGVSATGFASSTTTNYVAPALVDEDTLALEERIDAEDLNSGGPVVEIGGDVANGVLINGVIDTFISEEESEDETKDTIEDFDENRTTGSILSYGDGQALLISPDVGGPADGDIIIGEVVEQVRDTLDDDEDENVTETLATFSYDYGLINRGSIDANGLNVGYDATAVQISGSSDGAFTTEISGGVFNSGLIEADGFEANATAVQLDDGAIVGQLVNEGVIDATARTTDSHNATALQINEGAELTRIENTGQISATIVGDTGDAIAIYDGAGGITEITNSGGILADIVEDGEELTGLGSAIAIDLSNGASDVTLSQFVETPVDDINGDDVIDTDDVSNPAILGDILFGAGDDVFSATGGTIIGDTDFAAGDADMSLSDTRYEGDITFSDGVNTLTFDDSNVFGDIAFGGDSGVFTLSNGTQFEGMLTSSGGLSSLIVSGSDLALSSGSNASIDELSITGSSVLQINIDPTEVDPDPVLSVSGAADIGAGVSVQPVLENFDATNFSRSIVNAGDITFSGELDDSLVSSAPFLYNTVLTLNEGATDTLDLEFELKTAEELGLDVNQAGAYDAFLEVAVADEELGDALSGITEEADFRQTYDLLLPQRSDASTRFLSAQASATWGALSSRLRLIESGRNASNNVWGQQLYTYVEHDGDGDGGELGYNGSGAGFAAGYDRRLSSIDAVGFFIAYSSGEFEEKTGGDNPIATRMTAVGLYIKDTFGPISVHASGQYGDVDFSAARSLELNEETTRIEGDWGGTSVAFNAGASSELRFGPMYARPAVSIDYFTLEQDAYSEVGDDILGLTVSSSETDRVSAASTLALGAKLNESEDGGQFWAPEIRIGYRSELSSTPYSTTASFLGSDEAFTLQALEEFSDAVIAGVSIRAVSEYLSADFTYDAEIADDGIVHQAGATLRFKF